MAASRIKPLTYVDLPEAVRVATQSFRELPARQPCQIIDYLVPILKRSPGWSWKAVTGDRLEGYIVAQAYPSTGSVSLMHLAVRPELQGQGLGARLLETLEQRAQAEGLRRVQLATVYARRFYEQHGYRYVGADYRLIREICGQACPAPEEPPFARVEHEDLGRLLRDLGEEDGCRLLQAFYRWYGPGICLAARSGRNLRAVVVGGPRAREEAGGVSRADHPGAGDLFATEYWWAEADEDYPAMAAALACEASKRGARFVGLTVERGREGLVPLLEEHGYANSDWPSWYTMYWYEKELG